MRVVCCLLMSWYACCECQMHMSSQLVCSLVPFTPDSVLPPPKWAPLPPPQSFPPRQPPDSVHPTPRWTPLLPPQSFVQRQMFPDPAGVGYYPHCLGQQQGVHMCIWVLEWMWFCLCVQNWVDESRLRVGCVRIN